MTANELRIGNYIYDDNIVVTVNSFDIRDLAYGALNTIHFRPVPLTEDWLLKFGFDNYSESTNYCFKLNRFILSGSMKRLFPSVHDESGFEQYGCELKYVHQLQNLYFALTGEELTIK